MCNKFPSFFLILKIHSVDDVSFSKHEWKSFVDGGSLSQAYTFHVEMYEVDYVAVYTTKALVYR